MKNTNEFEFFSELDEGLLLDYLDAFDYKVLFDSNAPIDKVAYDAISKELRGLDNNDRDYSETDEIPF